MKDKLRRAAKNDPEDTSNNYTDIKKFKIQAFTVWYTSYS